MKIGKSKTYHIITRILILERFMGKVFDDEMV